MKAQKLPERKDVPAALTWDLSPMYASNEAWEQDFAELPALLSEFCTWRGRLAESPETLKQAIEASDLLERRAEKLYTYAHLRADENTADSANRSRLDRISSYFSEMSAQSAWFDPELLAIDDKRLEEMLAAPELKLYVRSIRELLRERPHTLTEPEERILGELSEVMGVPYETFGTLNDADLKFGKIRNAAGDKVELTHGSYRHFLEEPDRKTRKRAFKAMFDTYKSFEHTFANILNYAVKEHVVDARVRHYEDSLAAALFEDNIPADVYLNLIESVHRQLPSLHEYFHLRGQLLHIKNIDVYDLYTPVVPDQRCKYTWEEAVALVKAALQPLGEEYCAVVDRAFQERWVDVVECRGKRSGAYSSGCYDSNPYLLLNFHGTLNDVFTLAHELGHSLHSYYSNANQEYHYAEYSIFAAEVASITNEVLLFHHLMSKTSDPDFQAYLISHVLDEIRGTIFRQTMFAEFELNIHRLSEKGVPLVADLLNREYYKLKSQYMGPALNPHPLVEVEWARIPHFYYNFYVYKYATGMAAALNLATQILGVQHGVERYLAFLKAGDSKDVLDILADAGVNLRDSGVINAALEHFELLVRRLKSLIA